MALVEQLIPETCDNMRWELNTHQFQLYLDKEIQAIIANHLTPFVHRLCVTAGKYSVN